MLPTNSLSAFRSVGIKEDQKSIKNIWWATDGLPNSLITIVSKTGILPSSGGIVPVRLFAAFVEILKIYHSNRVHQLFNIFKEREIDKINSHLPNPRLVMLAKLPSSEGIGPDKLFDPNCGKECK